MNTTNQSYILSKEVRLLVAALTFCLAGWVWFNFFTQDSSVYRGQLMRSQASIPVVSSVSSNAVTVSVPVGEAETGSEAGSEIEGIVSSISVPGVSVAPAPVMGDIEILELPFLSGSPVYIPPSDEDVVETESAGPDSRPSGATRAATNPFAPINPTLPDSVIEYIELDPPPASSAPISSPPPVVRPPTLTTTSPEPTIDSKLRAPAPAAITPPPSFATSLPRSLARASLATAPRVLTRPTGAAKIVEKEPEEVAEPPVIEIEAPDNLATLVARRLPSGRTTPHATPSDTVAEAANDRDAAGASTTAEVAEPEGPQALPAAQLSSVQKNIPVRATPAQEPPPPPPAPEPVPVPEPPALEPIPVPAPVVEVVRNPLDSYIEDNALRFTGAVLGPVSVAVFRTNNQSFSIATGRSLPETNIVLTNVTADKAEVNLAGDVRTLALAPSLSARTRSSSN